MLKTRFGIGVALTLLFAAASLVLLLRPQRGGLYRTPEGAAFAAYMGHITERSDGRQLHWAHLVLNAPKAEPHATATLQRDLRQWVDTLLLIRDTSLAAKTTISADSLSALGEVWDIRPGLLVNSYHLVLDGDLPMSVVGTSCRGWPCAGGADVAVRKVLFWYRARTVVGVWVQ